MISQFQCNPVNCTKNAEKMLPKNSPYAFLASFEKNISVASRMYTEINMPRSRFHHEIFIITYPLLQHDEAPLPTAPPSCPRTHGLCWLRCWPRSCVELVSVCCILTGKDTWRFLSIRIRKFLRYVSYLGLSLQRFNQLQNVRYGRGCDV